MKTKLLEKLREKADDKFYIVEKFDDGWSYQTYHVLQRALLFGIFSIDLCQGSVKELEKIAKDLKRDYILRQVEKLRRKSYVGKEFVHYKGHQYKVISLGYHTETGERMVVYKATDDSSEKVWIRPERMWNEDVVYKDQIVKRFKEISQ